MKTEKTETVPMSDLVVGDTFTGPDRHRYRVTLTRSACSHPTAWLAVRNLSSGGDGYLATAKPGTMVERTAR